MSHPVPVHALYNCHCVQDKSPYDGAGKVSDETVALALGMAKKHSVLSWKVSLSSFTCIPL